MFAMSQQMCKNKNKSKYFCFIMSATLLAVDVLYIIFKTNLDVTYSTCECNLSFKKY